MLGPRLWVEGGITATTRVEIARAFPGRRRRHDRCSSGQVSKKQKPVYGACTRHRSPTASATRRASRPSPSGAISKPTTSTVSSPPGRADLVRGRRVPHLANPSWTLLEAAKIGYMDVQWPKQYRSAKTQLERNLEREKATAAQALQPIAGDH
jgi:anthraniloyl-CoA monooxygenase